jgi:ISXO2-like transposase domain/Transposase zinc-ribbon domain
MGIIRYLTPVLEFVIVFVMNMTAHQMTFRELLERFSDGDSCKRFLESKRWPDGVITCPRCGGKAFRLPSRPFHYVCKSGIETVDKETGEVVTCSKKNGYRFSVLTRTVFENTNYKLKEWFKVIFLMFHSKKGMSALQIHRMLGTGSYETAWFMCQRIRAAMRGDAFPLTGEIEADETYIGGKDKNRHWAKKSRQQREAGSGEGYLKTGVIGAIARKGNVVCRVIGDQDARTLSGFVRSVIADKVDLVATDENVEYKHLGRGIHHEAVNHTRGEYVRGNVHTNNIESFWSLLKRGVVGTYHNVIPGC